MLKQSKFYHKVTSIMLIIILLPMRIILLLDQKLDRLNIFAHDCQMEHIVPLSGHMVHITITLVHHGRGQGELVQKDGSLKRGQILPVFEVDEVGELEGQGLGHHPLLHDYGKAKRREAC